MYLSRNKACWKIEGDWLNSLPSTFKWTYFIYRANQCLLLVHRMTSAVWSCSMKVLPSLVRWKAKQPPVSFYALPVRGKSYFFPSDKKGAIAVSTLSSAIFLVFFLFNPAAHSPRTLSCTSFSKLTGHWMHEKGGYVYLHTFRICSILSRHRNSTAHPLATMPQVLHHVITRGHFSLPLLSLRRRGMRDQVSGDRWRNCFVAIKDA